MPRSFLAFRARWWSTAWTSAICRFATSGKHRRSTVRDVLALKTKIDAQRAAMEALADDAEDLKQRYGL